MGSGTTLEYCELTDIGRRRSNNQDSKAVLPPWDAAQYRRRGWLFVVADGMGAHAAGEMASALAVEHVPLVYEKKAVRSPPLALKSSIEQANSEIFARGESAVDLRGMGTTCTALALLPRGALVGHVGDSRVYRVRAATIDQLSCDHSLAWEMEAHRPAGAEEAIPKNIITRSMGPHPTVKVDVEGPFPVEADDVFVLCSDGLSNQVADEEIGLVAGGLAAPAAAAALVGLALVRGAPDNVTVIVARAGEREASNDTDPAPWPLTEEPAATTNHRPAPWGLLAVAAGSLLAALVAYGLLSTGYAREALGDSVAEALAVAVPGVLGLAFIGSLTAAIAGAMAPQGSDVRFLRPGARIGGGPYRTRGCTPSAELLEGIVSSVEAAADGLSTRDRERLLAAVTEARMPIAAGDFPKSLASAAAAIAIYRQIVEAARSDATAHG
ncbi:MAG: PP2C family protein-serine/threonine phosphatase [Planctomycetaceae bacterium]